MAAATLACAQRLTSFECLQYSQKLFVYAHAALCCIPAIPVDRKLLSELIIVHAFFQSGASNLYKGYMIGKANGFVYFTGEG